MQEWKIQDFILYEDKDIIVCHKPAGIPVQSARFGVMDLENGLKNYLAAFEKSEIPYLGIIHRLDQPVEGILVFAKNKKSAGELTRQLTAGQMGKYYLAVTACIPEKKEGLLEDYLWKDAKANTSFVASKERKGAKKARLYYWVLETLPDKSLLKIKLDTGRHHQIRVQMAHAGMGLLGDRKYNNQVQTDVPLGLCSYLLEFKHPSFKKDVRFQIRPKGRAFEGFSLEDLEQKDCKKV